MPGGASLPNRSRTAWITAVNGFHSAMVLSGPGIVPAPTNAEEMNVTGNSHTIPALCATSTLGTDNPISAPIHDIANPNSNSSR